MRNPNQLRTTNAENAQSNTEHIEAIHHHMPIRIASIYFGFSLIWIVVTMNLVWSEIQAEQRFGAYILNHAGFVLITTGLIYWLCRRGFRIVDRAHSLIRAVTNSTTDAVYVKDVNGKYIFCNEVAAGLIGKPLSEVFDRDDTVLFEPESAQKVIAWDQEVLATGERHTYEHDVSTGGATRTVSTTKSPFRDSDGNMLGVVGISRDITDRKRDEEKLNEQLRRLQISEKRFREMADAIPQIVWVADEEGRITQVNSKAVDYSGATFEDLLGSAWLKIIHPDDAGRAIASWNEMIRTQIPLHFELRIRRADGQYRWHISNTLPIRNSNGVVVEWYGTATDIEELKNVEHSLLEQGRLLKIVTSTARVGLTVINDRYEYEFANEAYAEIFKREVNQIIGVNVSELIPTAWPKIKLNMDRVLRGELVDYECSLPPVPGSTTSRFYRVIAQPRIDEGGRPTSVNVVTDISELTESKRVISESEELYRRLVELLPDAIYININNRITFCNSACVRLFGATDSSQLIGKSPFELIPPAAHEHVRNRMTAIFKTKEPAPPQRQTMIRLDGREIPVYVFATLITEGGVEGILACFNDLTERERATEVLHSIMGSVDDAIITINEQGVIQLANSASERIFGYPTAELTGSNIKMLMPQPYHDEHDEYFSNFIRTGNAKVIGIGCQVEGRRKDGTIFPLELTVSEFQLNGNRQFTGVVRDISERKRLEKQFQQSQKMEAVGRLAGGVAHDFNNLLTVINGYASQMLSDLPADSSQREFAGAILDAGDQAASLTQQLLALSRKSIVEPVHVDINDIVEQTSKMLRRLIEENIQLSVECDPNASQILAAPWQIEQVLMNLVVNARDAMPHGGRLVVKTQNATVSIDDRKMHQDVIPGKYVNLLVSDTGHGMSKEVQDKIFEPFFTTKDVGEGTGLGMSVVHGIVKQCGGEIVVESELNVGTTFNILFPVATEAASRSEPAIVSQASPGYETILLVEDQDAVRKIARMALEKNGYKVLEASMGPEAIRLAEEFTDPIDLLLTDVVMPEMGGQQLAEIMRQKRPGIRVLFMSGYTSDTALLRDVTKADEILVQKPFTATTLNRKVRAVLDGSA